MRLQLCLLALLTSAPAMAQETAEEAEMARLMEEMDKLADKNAWTGVERAYTKAVALGDPGFDAHLFGAQSARALGMTFDAVRRLQRARTLQDDDGVRADLEALEAAFARVKITSEREENPALTPATMPFAPDQRASIEYAQATFAETGAFTGMLPMGTYTLGDTTFTLDGSTGAGFVEVALAPPPEEPKTEKPAKEPKPPKEPGDGGGLAVGPLVMLGGGFISSPAPAAGDDLTVLEPGDTGYGQAMITAGVELASGIVGGALAADFAPGFGVSRYSQLGVWGALVLRPGPLHIAVGPSYQYYWGTGTGVADWLDRGQDPTQDLSTVAWKGAARAFGVRGEVGVGLAELGPFSLVVSAGGNYHSDGNRGFAGGGLSVGLVPGR